MCHSLLRLFPANLPASTLIEFILWHPSISIRSDGREGERERRNGLLTAARREHVKDWQRCSSHLRCLCGYQYPSAALSSRYCFQPHTNSLMRLSIKKIIFPSYHICNAEMRNLSRDFFIFLLSHHSNCLSSTSFSHYSDLDSCLRVALNILQYSHICASFWGRES